MLDLKIEIKHKSVPTYITDRGRSVGPSRNTLQKKDWHTGIVLLYQELCLNLNPHFRHGRALRDIGLWSNVHEVRIDSTEKVACTWKPWTIWKLIKN